MAETGSRMQAVSSIAGCAATSARDGDRSAYHVAPGGGRSSPRASRKVSGFAPRRGQRERDAAVPAHGFWFFFDSLVCSLYLTARAGQQVSKAEH